MKLSQLRLNDQSDDRYRLMTEVNGRYRQPGEHRLVETGIVAKVLPVFTKYDLVEHWQQDFISYNVPKLSIYIGKFL
jgi:hypothetical protein